MLVFDQPVMVQSKKESDEGKIFIEPQLIGL